ncbi:hypothetical protein [Micromonospora tulbaghiae]
MRRSNSSWCSFSGSHFCTLSTFDGYDSMRKERHPAVEWTQVD